ncbi:hypothetical protein GGI02_004945, partial [Coemansia sp. RSA 2322]
MDGFAFQLQNDAAESEGCLPQSEGSGVPGNGSSGGETGSAVSSDSLPSLSAVFGFAASWGKKIQNDLQLNQLVDQVKKQSEEVTRAYTQDISQFAQAVKVGASRGMDEISTRFSQLKTDLETELKDEGADGPDSDARDPTAEGQSVRDPAGSTKEAQGLLGGFGKHFRADMLKQRQEMAKRLMSKLGADLEDLLREAIVIEAPGSASTEEQRNAARKIIYDRRMAQLAAIQESKDTYLVDPRCQAVDIPGATMAAQGTDAESGDSAAVAGTAAGFAEFTSTFSLDSKQDEIAQLLADIPAIAQMHSVLVPEKVSEPEFWTRYFFRAWMVDQEEARRKKLVEAAVAAAVEEDFSWDMDEESDSEAPAKSSNASPNPKEAPKQHSEKPTLEAAVAAEDVPAENEEPSAAAAGGHHEQLDAETSPAKEPLGLKAQPAQSKESVA